MNELFFFFMYYRLRAVALFVVDAAIHVLAISCTLSAKCTVTEDDLQIYFQDLEFHREEGMSVF